MATFTYIAALLAACGAMHWLYRKDERAMMVARRNRRNER